MKARDLLYDTIGDKNTPLVKTRVDVVCEMLAKNGYFDSVFLIKDLYSRLEKAIELSEREVVK